MNSAALRSLRHYARLCELSYLSDAIARYEVMGYFAQEIRTHTSDQAYLLLNVQIRELTVVVRGTDQITDWVLRNFRAIPTFDDRAEGRVARGFWAGASALSVPVGDAIALTVAQGPLRNIVVTGHSLGGITADILVRQLWQQIGSSAVQVMTFGAPRGGDDEFARKCPCPLFRVVHPLDPVPRFYPRQLKFKHSGVPVVWDGTENVEYGQQAWDDARISSGDYLAIARSLKQRIQAHFAYFGGLDAA